MSTPEMQRLNDALAKVDELEQRLAKMGQNTPSNPSVWTAAVSITTSRTQAEVATGAMERDRYITNLNDPIFVQTSAMTKNVRFSYDHVQRVSSIGFGQMRTRITVTFDDETNVNNITITPLPQGLSRSGKSISWDATNADNWQLKETT